jgi:cyclase
VLTRRIIACLDVRDGVVVKGVRFRDHVVVGAIEDLALRYRDEGADELVFYDITASPEGRNADVAWIERLARHLDIPFCVAGGIRSVEQARRVLHAGADKISINSPALERPALITELADAFGVQCVVVGIDSVPDGAAWRGRSDGSRDADPPLARRSDERRDPTPPVAGWRVKQYTGDPSRTRDAPWRTLDWVREVQRLGAGEIVLNCMNADGMRSGYDLEQLGAARAACRVPLVASGGAGTETHFRDVFQRSDVDAALAASVFHSGAIAIPALKQYLWAEGIRVRPCSPAPSTSSTGSRPAA